jgi:hypothetical protein
VTARCSAADPVARLPKAGFGNPVGFIEAITAIWEAELSSPKIIRPNLRNFDRESFSATKCDFGRRLAAEIPPPTVNLLRRNIMPPRDLGHAGAGRNDLIQYRELLRVRPKPPTLAPG